MTLPLEVDATSLCRTLLAAAMPSARVVTVLPSTLVPPVVQVFRIGGPDDGVMLDLPTIAVHAYTADEAQANQLCYQAGTVLRNARGAVVGGAVITRVRKLSGPYRAETSDQNLRHAVSLFQVYVKTA